MLIVSSIPSTGFFFGSGCRFRGLGLLCTARISSFFGRFTVTDLLYLRFHRLLISLIAVSFLETPRASMAWLLYPSLPPSPPPSLPPSVLPHRNTTAAPRAHHHHHQLTSQSSHPIRLHENPILQMHKSSTSNTSFALTSSSLSLHTTLLAFLSRTLYMRR